MRKDDHIISAVKSDSCRTSVTKCPECPCSRTVSKKVELSLRETVSRNIRALRLESGITQSELAARCGFKKQYISRLESSPQNINLEVLEKLS